MYDVDRVEGCVLNEWNKLSRREIYPIYIVFSRSLETECKAKFGLRGSASTVVAQ